MAHPIRITRYGFTYLFIEDEDSIHSVPLGDARALRIRNVNGEVDYKLEDLPLRFNIANLSFGTKDLGGRLAIYDSYTDRLLYCWKLKASPMTIEQRDFLHGVIESLDQADIPSQSKAITQEIVYDTEGYHTKFKHRVDLASLKHNLQAGVYQSVEHFKSHFYLIDQNLAEGNVINRSMWIAAQDLNAAFEKEMERLPASLPQNRNTTSSSNSTSSHTRQDSHSSPQEQGLLFSLDHE